MPPAGMILMDRNITDYWFGGAGISAFLICIFLDSSRWVNMGRGDLVTRSIELKAENQFSSLSWHFSWGKSFIVLEM